MSDLIVGGPAQSGAITAGDEPHQHRFAVNAPGVYTVVVNADDDFEVSVQDGNAQTQTQSSGSGIVKASAELPAGHYFAYVGGSTATSEGNYTIRLKRGNGP